MAAASKPAAKRSTRSKAAAAKAVQSAEVEELDLDALTAELESEDGPIGPGGEIRPVQIGKRGRTPNELVHIFSLDGKDYFIPSKVSPARMIKFLRDARSKKVGRVAATEDLITDMLGEEALDALAESLDVTEDDMADIFTIVAKVTFGSFAKVQESTSGNS